MKKVMVSGTVVVMFLVMYLCAWSQETSWQELHTGELHFNTVAVETTNPSLIYAGTESGVVVSNDAGKTWRRVLSVKGENKSVYCLVIDQRQSNVIYAATGNGLYCSLDRAANWSRIFKGKSLLENACTAVSVMPNALYLGTKAGLFVTKDNGKTWDKESGRLGNSSICSITYCHREPEYRYVACADGVFMTKDSQNAWQRVYSAEPTEAYLDSQEEPERGEEDEPIKTSHIHDLIIDQKNPHTVYLATSKGVLESKDRGITWQRLSRFGLLTSNVRSIEVDSDARLYAITKTAISLYNGQRWEELPFSASSDIRCLIEGGKNTIYVACDEGLFKIIAQIPGSQTHKDIIAHYQCSEPTIRDVQKAAIRYAQVEPEKIIEWSQQARNKAWLPKISVGLNRNSTDLWHWESGSTIKSGDDELVRGHDSLDWDLSLSWELGNLIWNNDQTSIDTRSRLMVQLREDVLDEVNKLYFERLRIKKELDSLTIEEIKKRFEKELKLQELTASLDSFTGGYFSENVHPETKTGS